MVLEPQLSTRNPQSSRSSLDSGLTNISRVSLRSSHSNSPEDSPNRSVAYEDATLRDLGEDGGHSTSQGGLERSIKSMSLDTPAASTSGASGVRQVSKTVTPTQTILDATVDEAKRPAAHDLFHNSFNPILDHGNAEDILPGSPPLPQNGESSASRNLDIPQPLSRSQEEQVEADVASNVVPEQAARVNQDRNIPSFKHSFNWNWNFK